MKNVRIGLLIAQSGAAGLWAPSAEACGRLAVRELNSNSGILKRPVELCVVDAGQSAQSAAEAAHRAIEEQMVEGVVTMIPSYARESVAAVTSDRVPLVYTPQFEGSARERNVMTTGETAVELIAPALRWLMEKKGAKRFFLCGNDYIWPRNSLSIARELIRRAGGLVTGELYVPVGVNDYDEILDRVAKTRSDVVMPYFLGSDSIAFNRAFCDMGLSPRVLRFSSAIDETIVYGLRDDETENIFVSSAYFSSIRSRNNGAFLERYHTAFGDNPPPANAFGQSCYEGIYSLASMVEQAGSFDIRLLKRVFGRAPLQKTARGNEATPAVGSRHPVHVARIDGYEFSILTPA
ncbi:ABC-type branched-chain amino acid transport system, substrate-binding protein [Ensifer adhaerens]|nr:ABC-type branched-chain amino acid transport system, substrate-binding protein [Ensifer adhaerens]HZG28321.1 substrate-binding domain-containing protein [Ensifer sp.]